MPEAPLKSGSTAEPLSSTVPGPSGVVTASFGMPPSPDAPAPGKAFTPRCGLASLDPSSSDDSLPLRNVPAPLGLDFSWDQLCCRFDSATDASTCRPDGGSTATVPGRGRRGGSGRGGNGPGGSGRGGRSKDLSAGSCLMGSSLEIFCDTGVFGLGLLCMSMAFLKASVCAKLSE